MRLRQKMAQNAEKMKKVAFKVIDLSCFLGIYRGACER